MSTLFSFVPHSAPPGSDPPAVTPEQLDQLCCDVRRAQLWVEPSFASKARAVASLLRDGQQLYWGFETLSDTLACVRSSADPRYPLPPDTQFDVLRLDGERLLSDVRFVSPGAASLVGEMPHLALPQQRELLKHANYRHYQWVFRPLPPPQTDQRAQAAASRVPADLLLQRVLLHAARKAETPSERQRIRMLPRELASWTVPDLADSAELFRAGMPVMGRVRGADPFPSPRRADRRRR